MTTPDNNTPSLAREWAKMTLNRGAIHPPIEGCDAAAEVIRDLPDVIVDGDKLREISSALLSEAVEVERTDPARASTLTYAANSIDTLLPTPPTMADMTPEDRQACQWMQATVLVEEDAMTGVIQKVRQDIVWLMFRSGNRNDYRLDEVVPRDDLPRMEWPGDGVVDAGITPDDGMEPEQEEWMDGVPKKSLEEYKAGQFVPYPESDEEWEQNEQTCTSTEQGSNSQKILDSSIRPEDVTKGEAWRVIVADPARGGMETNAIKEDIGWCHLDEDGEDMWTSDKYVTLVSRLVPERARKTLTSAQDYKDAAFGTVVKVSVLGSSAWQKDSPTTWESLGGMRQNSTEMSFAAREVLWEPDGEAWE